jgi:uncharacterized protein (TIGR03086 family)
MQANTVIASAAKTTRTVVGAISADQLDAPTPCDEFTVRALINHLLFWGPSQAAAAVKESVPPPGSNEREVDLTEDWATKLTALTDSLAAGWGEPEAWEGETFMGGPTAMPARMVGGMVAAELVVHTWDLARATGQEAVWEPDVLSFVHTEMAGMAKQGREMGIFGPEVPVAGTAPLLHRTLGLSGRDPQWSA